MGFWFGFRAGVGGSTGLGLGEGKVGYLFRRGVGWSLVED